MYIKNAPSEEEMIKLLEPTILNDLHKNISKISGKQSLNITLGRVLPMITHILGEKKQEFTQVNTKILELDIDLLDETISKKEYKNALVILKKEQEVLDETIPQKQAKVTINGVIPQMFMLIVGDPGSGKECAGLTKRVTRNLQCKNISNGTGAGIKDVLVENDVVLFNTNEFASYLSDESSHASQARDTLLGFYSEYGFEEATSKLTGNKCRKTNYCVLNFIGNIQPGMLKESLTTHNLKNSGFWSRFLTINMPNVDESKLFTYGDSDDFEDVVINVTNIIRKFRGINGKFKVPSLFNENAYSELQYTQKTNGTVGRYFNMYLPIFALICSVDKNSRDYCTTQITEEGLNIAKYLTYYFCEQLLLTTNNFNVYVTDNRYDKLYNKVLEYVKNNKNFTSSNITSKCCIRDKNEKDKILESMIDSDIIDVIKIGKKYTYTYIGGEND